MVQNHVYVRQRSRGQGRSSSVFLCLRSVQEDVTLMNMCGDITEGMALRTTSFHLAYPINQSDKQIKRESLGWPRLGAARRSGETT